jgi:hypothetical protein
VSFCFFLERNGAQQTSKEFALVDFVLKATTAETNVQKAWSSIQHFVLESQRVTK